MWYAPPSETARARRPWSTPSDPAATSTSIRWARAWDAAARLERRRRAPSVLEGLAQHHRRVRERAVHVTLAVAATEENAVGRQRRLDRRDRRERLVLHPDALARVGNDVGIRRHDRGDRLPAEVDAAVGEDGPRGRREPVAFEPGLERPRDRADVGGGDDAQDAVEGGRG